MQSSRLNNLNSYLNFKSKQCKMIPPKLFKIPCHTLLKTILILFISKYNKYLVRVKNTLSVACIQIYIITVPTVVACK